MDDPDTLRQNVRELLAVDFESLLVGNSEPILQAAKERLGEMVATFPGQSKRI